MRYGRLVKAVDPDGAKSAEATPKKRSGKKRPMGEDVGDDAEDIDGDDGFFRTEANKSKANQGKQKQKAGEDGVEATNTEVLVKEEEIA